MSSYRLSKSAEHDLIKIGRYIAEKASLDAAENLLTEIIESIILIASHPGVGRPEDSVNR